MPWLQKEGKADGSREHMGLQKEVHGGGALLLIPSAEGPGDGGQGSVEDIVPSRGLAHWGAQIPGCPTPCGPSSAPFPLPLLRALQESTVLFSEKDAESLCPNSLELRSLVPTASTPAQAKSLSYLDDSVIHSLHSSSSD